MKNTFTLLTCLFLSTSLWSQSPNKMSYQAILRNSNQELVSNKTIGMQISILYGSVSGNPVYVETHSPTSSEHGVVSIEIGSGILVSGDFSKINWVNGPYFLKTESDPEGGSNYSVTGTSQFLSVPLAMHANSAEQLTNNFYLGQDTLGGIVFFISRDSLGVEHGLIMSKTEGQGKWETGATFVGANRTWDGVYNTNLMRNSPAASYATSLGSGWYLPSIDELLLILHNGFHVNKALFEGGYTLLALRGYYWSSTEKMSALKYAGFSSGASGAVNPSLVYSVRAIRAF